MDDIKSLKKQLSEEHFAFNAVKHRNNQEREIYLELLTHMRHLQSKLERAKVKAEAASQAKSLFLANMSHEIRTPMNAVLGFTDILGKTELDDVQKDYLNTIQESSNILLVLINDILDFSKIEAKEIILESEDFDFKDLIENVVKLIRPGLKDKDIKLSLEIDQNIPRSLKGDAVRVRQIFLNILSNAAKFTDKGEIKIVITNANNDMSDELNGVQKVKVLVQDTGIGIPKDKQKEIFKPFSQADNSITRQYGGSGLGLSIIKSLIEMMEGDISLDSEVGKGTTVCFSLTLEESKQYIVYKDIKPVSLDELENKKVIILDDEVRVCDQMEEYCVSAKMDVIYKSTDPLDVIAWLKEHKHVPDIIICDIVLPQMDGYSFINEIRQIDEFKSIEFIAATAYPMYEVKRQVKESGFGAFIYKPINEVDFIKVLAIVLSSDRKKENVLVTEEMSDVVFLNELTILVAEDNPLNQKLIRLLLGKLGCKVDIADDGKEAINKLKENQYDICLMDVQMPVMSGIEAIKVIRKEISDDLIVIALTASAMEGDREMCLDAGMNDYITKPVNMAALKKTLTECLIKKNNVSAY